MSNRIIKYLPPRISQRIQGWMIVLGLIGMIAAPFLSQSVAIKVINEISMLTLVVAGLAGLDATRPNVEPKSEESDDGIR